MEQEDGLMQQVQSFKLSRELCYTLFERYSMRYKATFFGLVDFG